MNWPGALQKKATHSRLEPHGKDVRAVTVYTHMFVLGDRTGRADEREHPHYTATGATPEEAKAAAYEVYQRAVECAHTFGRKTPMLLECSACGVQKRTPLVKSELEKPAPAAQPRRKRFGFLSRA